MILTAKDDEDNYSYKNKDKCIFNEALSLSTRKE